MPALTLSQISLDVNFDQWDYESTGIFTIETAIGDRLLKLNEVPWLHAAGVMEG